MTIGYPKACIVFKKKKKLKETACLATPNPHPTQKYATQQQTQDLQDYADFLLCILLDKLPKVIRSISVSNFHMVTQCSNLQCF